MNTFKELGINPKIVKALAEFGFDKPTAVQQEIIPVLLNNQTDIIVQAQTGTGKTAAYGLPIVERIDVKKNVVQSLILCPTRELSQQVAKQLFRFTKYSDKIFAESVYGGEHIEKQITALQRPTHIVVATPGRLIDLVKRKAVNLTHVNTLVLDEADEMLSMGFSKELNEILSFLSAVKNKWLFSATIPQGVNAIIQKYLSENTQHFKINKGDIVNNKITHQYITCDDDEKLHVLIQFLKFESKNRGILFCKTKKTAQTLSKQLLAKNIAVDAIHGDLLQKERDKAMRAFKNKKLQALIATDIAARGIDVEGLAFVVHYQLPESEDYYTHRSGRTARAGKSGISLCLVNPSEMHILKRLEKNLHIKFEKIKRK